METLTQDIVDEVYATAKAEWDKKVTDSGHCEATFIVLDEDNWASQFLVGYAMARENVESQGLVLPPISKDLTVTLQEEVEDVH